MLTLTHRYLESQHWSAKLYFALGLRVALGLEGLLLLALTLFVQLRDLGYAVILAVAWFIWGWWLLKVAFINKDLGVP